MDQEVAVIHQDPIRLFVSFRADREFAKRFELAVNFVAYGLPLPGIAGGADHKEVSEGGDLSQVEHAEISGFFGFGCPNSGRPVAAFVFGLRGGMAEIGAIELS